MDDIESTRRTALKLLGAGAAVTTGAGVVAGGDHAGDDDRKPEDDEERRQLYVADLTPQEGVETKARGFAAFQLRGDSLTFALALANIEETFMTHIHEDEVLGPIAVWLHDFQTQDEDLVEGRFTGLLDAGTITDEVIQAGRVPEAESETVDDLVAKIEAGEAFVNTHTEDNPDGELAGRIERFALTDRSMDVDEVMDQSDVDDDGDNHDEAHDGYDY